MKIACTIVGLALVLIVLRDVVHELFAPENTGSLSRAVMHGVWRAIRLLARWRGSLMHRAGAIVLLSVAFAWVSLLALGFALLYLPRLPLEFHVDSATPAADAHGFATALYVSLASLTTLSSGDVVPRTSLVRFAAALESMLGAALITAWISWVLSIYPVLARRRAYARDIDLLCDMHDAPALIVREEPTEAVAALLRSLAQQTSRVATDLVQTRVSYYFQNRTTDLSLAVVLPYLLTLASAADTPGSPPALRRLGAMLHESTTSLLDEIGTQFLGLDGATPDAVLRELARDHRIEIGQR